MSDAIVVQNLYKRYETRERRGLLRRGKKKIVNAVNGISFNVKRGEIFGLLGPNGAGKTTTVKILATLLIPDAGDAWVNGHHVVKEDKKVRESIGVSLFSDRGFYWKLTGRENLTYFAMLYHLDPKEAKKRIDYLLELVEIKREADKLVEEYSTGMKAKLNIARALLTDAPVLLLDEPTIGLDPNSARKIREILLTERKRGKAILLTTHNMEEADQLCDRIAIINQGKIIAIGTPQELKNMVQKTTVIEVEAAGLVNTITSKLRQLDGVKYVTLTIKNPQSLQGKIRIGINRDSNGILPEIVSILYKNGIKIHFVRPLQPSLEDVFITLTGRGFYEENQRH